MEIIWNEIFYDDYSYSSNVNGEVYYDHSEYILYISSQDMSTITPGHQLHDFWRWEKNPKAKWTEISNLPWVTRLKVFLCNKTEVNAYGTEFVGWTSDLQSPKCVK